MDVDGSESGSVAPIPHCPHVKEFLKEPKNIDVATPCTGCSDTKENWICLTCYEVGCSRFQKGHAVSHFEKTKHPLVMSFSDLSFWCYDCESYIKNPKLELAWLIAYKSKFGMQPGRGKTIHSAVCNKCFTTIVGSRYKCTVCADFDLCEKCYGEKVHDADHSFNKHEKELLVENMPQSFSGKRTDEDIEEKFDAPEEVEKKVKQLAEIVKKSKHLVVYTGAGVSTSAKIPDYRGPSGVWTLRDKGLAPIMPITIEQALPTPTHMALMELWKKGVVKFVVSTNVDGLHRRSGLPVTALAELHGNCYKELCSNKECGKEYLRYYDVTGPGYEHKTGRKCDDCKSALTDTIINFGENLPEHELKKAHSEANKSDIALVLGTSMRVAPANKFPTRALQNKGKMIIVNLQSTPYDSKASILIRERTDKVMQMLCKELGVAIPEYKRENDEIKKLED